jgi:hypothetical protein
MKSKRVFIKGKWKVIKMFKPDAFIVSPGQPIKYTSKDGDRFKQHAEYLHWKYVKEDGKKKGR